MRYIRAVLLLLLLLKYRILSNKRPGALEKCLEMGAFGVTYNLALQLTSIALRISTAYSRYTSLYLYRLC